MEISKAASGRAGLDWPHTEGTRRIHSQKDHTVEPTVEAQERQTPAHLEVHKNGRIGGETAQMTGSEMRCSKQGQVAGTSG